MEKPTVASVADAMYALVKECHGKRQLKPLDLNKAMLERFAEGCDKAMCKEAIRLLIESDRCIYSYVGGSTIVLPPEK
jgi:DNA-binding MurR/RpiR family transcriptional regulator